MITCDKPAASPADVKKLQEACELLARLKAHLEGEKARLGMWPSLGDMNREGERKRLIKDIEFVLR